MKPRSKKYYQRRKEQSGEKKGSVTGAGYNEDTIASRQSPKENPGPPKSGEDPLADTLPSQGDIDVIAHNKNDALG